MTKTGWWSVQFNVTLEGIGIDFGELSEGSREHILKLIADGCVAGEVVEETDDEEEDDDNG